MMSGERQTEESEMQCDGGFSCAASTHIEGCYTGDGHPRSERQTEPHQAEEWWTLTVCSHCGEQAGANSHGHSDARDWFWRQVVVVPEAELARVRVEKVTDGMGHVWTEESDLDRLDELEAEVVRLRAERNIALDRAKGWRDRATAAEARVAELEEQIGWTVQRCNAAIGDGFQGNANSAVAAVCDRLEGVQDRIDRAVAERTAGIVALLRRNSETAATREAKHFNYMLAKLIEREFPAPTRTQEANAAALDALADHPKPGKIGTREASDGD